MRRKNSDLLNGPLLKNCIYYTVPIILSGVLQLLFNAADLVVVGQFCGSVSVAAVGATGSLINLIVNLFIGLSVGAGVLVAQGIGAGSYETVHRTVHTAIPAAVLGGLFLTAVGVFGSRIFLEWMKTPDDVIGLSAVYMQIYFCGIIAVLLYNFGASILRATGDTKGPLLFLTAAGVVNVLLNLLFVIVLKMDVAGVALATALSQVLAAGLVIASLMHRTDACCFRLKDARFYKAQLLQMLKIGVPAGVQGSLFSISNVLIQSGVNSFGSVAMSGNAAAANIEGFVYTSMNSLHQTAVNFTGQNYGAKKYDRIARIAACTLGCVTVVGAAMGVSGRVFARSLLSIYITDSPAAVAYGTVRMNYICLPYFLCGLMDVTTGILRGMGASMLPMIISVAGVCGLRIFWIAAVFSRPLYHTPQVLYLSYPISWTITFAAELAVYLVLLRRLRRGAKADKQGSSR